MKKILSVLILCMMTIGVLQAQIDPEAARRELEKRGLNESDISQKLLEKGIDINNVDPDNLEDVEKALEEAVEELEQENQDAVIDAAQELSDDVTDKETDKIVEEKIQEVAKETEEVIEEAIEKGTEIDVAISEQLIDAQVDKKATIYGHEMFRNQEIELYTSTDEIKPPDTYILGVGDIVTVQIWGNSQITNAYPIEKDGYIKPKAMRRIALKGVTLGKARKLLRSRFNQYYDFNAGEFEVTVSYSRTILVNIVGEVINPGGFTIPATNTAFNALMAAQGPTDIGSVRNIKLISADGTTRKMDIYEYRNDPSIAQDYYLQANDHIFVAVVGRLVTFEGAIKKPFTFELIDGENLLKALEFAGGFKSNAIKENIQIKRFEDDEERIIDVNLKALASGSRDFELRDGDVITVKNIPTPYKNFAEVTGQVELPGRYEISRGMRVRDLITKAGIRDESRTDIAYISRTNADQTIKLIPINLGQAIADAASPDNFEINPKDRLIVYSKSDFTDKATFSVSGAVRVPGTFDLKEDDAKTLRVYDAITLAKGTVQTVADFAYIKSTEPTNRKLTSYQRINIKEVLENPQSPENIKMKPNDQLIIYSKETFEDASTVSTGGAVRSPSQFDYDEGLRISDVVYFSGGLSRDAHDFAYIERTDPINRKLKEYIRIDNIKAIVENPDSPNNINLKPFDVLRVYSVIPYGDETFISVRGAVRKPTRVQYDETLSLKDVLTFANGLKLEAANSRVEISRVVLDQDKTTEIIVATVEVDNEYNIVSGNISNLNLQPFDQVIVRYAPEFELQRNITIAGEVRFPGPYPLLDKNEQILSVISRAGGLTDGSFPEGATLYRNEDSIGYVVMDLAEAMKEKNSKFNYILKAGDVVFVPKKKDLVTIKGETRAKEIYPDKLVDQGNKITVAYHKGRSAKFYVDKYAAGIGDNGRRRLITVEHPNGEITRTRNYVFFKRYPTVRKGSVITVGSVPIRVKDAKEGKNENIDWNKVIADSIAQAISILTLIILIQRVD